MTSDKYYMELESENTELQERLANLGGIMRTQEERDYYKEENEKLKEQHNKWDNPCGLGMMNKEATELYQELQKENKELKDLVDYDGFKLQILETEVNNAMEYIDEAIERYSSPNPMVHKSTMLADFDKLKKLLMN